MPSELPMKAGELVSAIGAVMSALCLVLATAAVVTAGSSIVTTTVQVAYPGSSNCALGCDFVAGGWPFPYLVDHPGISPIGSVSLLMGLIGVDILRADALAASFVFWVGVFAALTAIVRWRAVRRPDPGPPPEH